MTRPGKSKTVQRLFLATLCLALGAAAYAQWQTEISVAKPMDRAVVIDRGDGADAGRDQTPLAALADLVEVVERPLFHKSRRPPSAQEIAKTPVVLTLAPKFRLEGIVISQNQPLAVVRVAGKAETIRVGEMVDGWRVEEIGHSTIVVSRGTQRQQVEMQKAGRGSPAVVAPAPRRRRAVEPRREAKPVQ